MMNAVKMMFLATLFAATVAQAVTLTVDQVRQRYPWNGLVDIDYTIALGAGEAAPDPLQDQLAVTFVNPMVPSVTNVAHVFLSAPLPVGPGSHRITWCANDDGFTMAFTNVTLNLSIDHYREAYMVIDVSSGIDSDTYPVTYLNAAPKNGFTNDVYRGDKIALRLIPPGAYMAGSPTNEPGRAATGEDLHFVTITKPFYIGVFETTQKQFCQVVDKITPSQYLGDYRPMVGCSYKNLHGDGKSNEKYSWPTSTDVDPDLFFGRLRARAKRADDNGSYTIPVGGFDLPTEYCWEYACRAGTTTSYCTGVPCATLSEQQSQMARVGLAWDAGTGDQTDGGPATVGTFLPNSWGLYDMHGNARECCLDALESTKRAELQTRIEQKVDPAGFVPETRDQRGSRVYRGGASGGSCQLCRSAARATTTQGTDGFRICCPAQ